MRSLISSYDTNIPRQVGLAGSSAIVSAVLKSLMKFYGVTVWDEGWSGGNRKRFSLCQSSPIGH